MTESFSPRLLVSIRNASEANSALEGGCDILDIKEPNRGSLGMADVLTIANVLGSVRSRGTVSISAALGETSDWISATNVPRLPGGLDYVKLGLSEMGQFPDWMTRWQSVRRRFEERTESTFGWIAVVYADWKTANSPEPGEIIDAAAETGCAGVLFDTFVKDGKTLLDRLAVGELQRLVERIRSLRMLSAVAGSLHAELFPEVLAVHPEIVAVRGAACCEGKRTSVISSERVRTLKNGISENFPTVPAKSGETLPSTV